jgi:hypothetical protein
VGVPCPRCASILRAEVDDVAGELIQVCWTCGERIWARPASVGEPPRRSAKRAQVPAAEGVLAGRRLLFDAAQVEAIIAALAAGVPLERVARRFGCAYETIRRIRAGQYY